MLVALSGVAVNGVAVRGESFADKVFSECGIRNRRRAGGDLGDLELEGDRGGRDTAGDFNDGPEEKAGLVAEVGCDVGQGPPFSNVNLGMLPPKPTGLLNTGVSAFKKSV